MSFLVEQVTSRVVWAHFDGGSTPRHGTPGEFLALCNYSEGIFQGIGRAMVAVLILAEIMALPARVAPALELWPFGHLLAVPERAGLLGVALLLLAFAHPLATGICWLI